MQIKDFKVGQIVYITGNKGTDIFEKEVVKVGRKYVFVHCGSWEEKYEVPLPGDGDKDLYLIEAKDWGDRAKLYKSKEDIFADRRITAIRNWLFGSYGSYGKAQRHIFTLDELENAVKALDPDGKYEDEIK